MYTPDAFREIQAEEMLAPAAEHVRDAVAVEYSDSELAVNCVANILAVAENNSFTLDELMARKAEQDSYFMGKFLAQPTDQKWVDEAHRRAMQMTPDGWFCTLCGKQCHREPREQQDAQG